MGWTVGNFIALAVVFAVLAVVSTGLRFWARAHTKARIGPDDYLVIPALIGVLGIAATMIAGTQFGEMAQHQTNVMGPDGPVYTPQLRAYEICNYILQLLPLLSLGFSKLSVLFLYRRLFHIHPRFMIVNAVLMGLVITWAVSFFFVTAFQCKDPASLWAKFEYQRTNCVQTVSFYYAVSITGFITDLMILISPIYLILKLHLPWGKRIAVACILQLGILVCAAGIARFVTFVHVGEGFIANINDLTYFTTPVFAWTMIESSLAVVGANLPLLRPVLLQGHESWQIILTRLSGGTTRRSNNSNSNSNNSNGSNIAPLGLSPSYPAAAHMRNSQAESLEMDLRSSRSESHKNLQIERSRDGW